MGSKQKIEIFYDFVSPYGWIGFEIACRYREKWGYELDFKPTFLGGIMVGSGNKPPATIPNKAVYGSFDVSALSKHYNVPTKRPSDPSVIFGTASLKALRFVNALKLTHPNYVENVSRELWMRIWNKDLPIDKLEHIKEAAKLANVPDDVIDNIFGRLDTKEVKDLVKTHVEEALSYNAFGVPTYIVHDGKGNKQMVFGTDRWHIIADLMGKIYEGPLLELAAYRRMEELESKQKIEIYYDFVSPYGWIGFEIACRYRQKWGFELDFKPTFLGGIMVGSGNKTPAAIPNKAAYVEIDLPAVSKHYNVPIMSKSDPSSVFGTISLNPLRFVNALKLTHPQHVENVSREIWMRIWNKDLPIDHKDDITEAARLAGVKEDVIESTLQKLGTKEAKDLVKANVDEALSHKAFGIPTYIVHDGKGNKHMVFGSDRWHIIADLLGKTYEGPLLEFSAHKSKL